MSILAAFERNVTGEASNTSHGPIRERLTGRRQSCRQISLSVTVRVILGLGCRDAKNLGAGGET